MEKVTQYLIKSTVHTSEVRAWEEDILLPTYEIGKEEKNPIFLERECIKVVAGLSTLTLWWKRSPIRKWKRNIMLSLSRMNISRS